MKLSEYAKKNSITYRTAWNRWTAGKLNGFIDETGHVVLTSDLIKREEHTIIYCRVSSTQNKSNLATQANRLVDYCNAKGWKVNEIVKEIGSGLNDNRPKLLSIIRNKFPTRIVVEHKDRLTRFGFNYIQECCNHLECSHR